MSGITQHKPDKAFEGYTLFSETFAEPNWEVGKEAVVYLIDMDGEPAHTWHLTQHTVQSHCRLLPNGHLLVPTHDRSASRSAATSAFLNTTPTAHSSGACAVAPTTTIRCATTAISSSTHSTKHVPATGT